MQLVGALFRAAVESALGLLAARGIAKHEFGAAHTLIQARQNNPLKVAADADDALSRLLQLPQHGFIAALPAVSETFDALRAHEVQLLAATRVEGFKDDSPQRDRTMRGRCVLCVVRSAPNPALMPTVATRLVGMTGLFDVHRRN